MSDAMVAIVVILVLLAMSLLLLASFGKHGLPGFALLSSLGYFVITAIALAACGLVWFFHAISQVQT